MIDCFANGFDLLSIDTDTSPQSFEQPGTCPAIELMIYPQQHDLGGFYVRRALPSGKRRMIGPWIFFDHMGPAVFAPGQGIDVRPHPHINLATVTYLFEGEIFHRDSLGNALVIQPGEINLMVAGKGVVHSERQCAEVKARNNVLNGLQLWLALPEADEEIEPEFHHYASAEIPALTVNSVAIRVLIGAAYGVVSPVKTFAKTLYVEASLSAGQSLVLPTDVDERAVYVIQGKLNTMDTIIDQYSMAVLQHGQTLTVTAAADTRLAVIGGEQLSHRHIWWNFVSSRQQRIEQAKRDWLRGAFPKVPADEIEFIPLPEK